MKRVIIYLFITTSVLFSTQNVEITAENFKADQKSGLTEFSGNVKMKKGFDELNASRVLVYFDQNRKPYKYETIGDSSFIIYMQNGSYYKGKANRLIYFPKKEIYELYGDVILNEPNFDRVVIGERVIVDRESGKAFVEGAEKKPVKFIFRVDEEDANKSR